MTSGPITVFGGTGFLGRRIVDRLLRAGWRVRVAARRAREGSVGEAEACPANITDSAAVARAAAGAHAVVNAVALYSEHGRETFDSVHVEAAAGLAHAAQTAGVERLIHVSGIGADPASPSRYVAARGRGEAAVRDACPEAVILRPSVLFGSGDAFLTTLDALTRMPLVPLFGRGRTRVQPVYVDDVAMAVERIVEFAEPPATLFELGGAEVLEYRRILEQVMAHRGRQRPLLPVPFAVWHLLAGAGRVLPRPPLTRDQVILMQHDNVAGDDVAGFGELGIEARGLSAGLAESLPPRC